MATSADRRKFVGVKILLALVAFAGTLVVATPQAHAEDRRPCVSKVEFQSAYGRLMKAVETDQRQRTDTQDEAEARWEVTRRGTLDADLSGKYLNGYIYRACGYDLDEMQVWVLYSKSSHQLMNLYRKRFEGATLHGQP